MGRLRVRERERELNAYNIIYIYIYSYRVGGVCVRAYSTEGRKKRAGGLFFYIVSPLVFPVPHFRYHNLYISQPPQKPVTVPHRVPKYLHTELQPAANFRRPSQAPPKTAIYLHIFFFFFIVILFSSSCTHNGYPASTTTTTIGRYI